MNKNDKLLNEELKKFKLMTEYAFYEDRGETADVEDLLLGDVSEEEEDMDSAADDISNELGGGEDMGAEEEPMAEPEEPMDGQGPVGEPIEPDVPPTDIQPIDEPVEEPSDEIELDVTELVQGTEEAKQSADMANERLAKLMDMVGKLEGQITDMDAISSKIDTLGGEMAKRMPTDDEKLEMRSLDSAPFNMRLGDFWEKQEGRYDVMHGDNKEDEYTLTRDDIDGDYSDSRLKDTFDQSYEEEEI